jgi:hypothetical protein
LHRSRGERFAAWLVTGPLGHLYSVLTDLAIFAAEAVRRRLARRSS